MAESAVRTTRAIGNEELSFFARAIRHCRKSRRRRLQMSLVLNNRRRVSNLVWFLFDCLFPKEHHSSSSSSFLPSVSFRIHLCCTLKSVAHSPPPNCLLSNTLHSFSNTEHRMQTWFINFKQVTFRALEARGIHIFSLLPPISFPKDQNTLVAHDKKRKRA